MPGAHPSGDGGCRGAVRDRHRAGRAAGERRCRADPRQGRRSPPVPAGGHRTPPGRDLRPCRPDPLAGRRCLYPNLGCDRASVADVLDIAHLVVGLEAVEVAGEEAVAVEVEKTAFLGLEEAMILARVELSDTPEKLVLIVMVRLLGAPVALFLQFVQLPLRDAKGLVDCVVQIGRMELPPQVRWVMRHDHHRPSGDPEFEMDYRGHTDGAVRIFDPDPAGYHLAVIL